MVSCLYDSSLEETVSLKPHDDDNLNLREWNRRELSALRPVDRRGVDGDSLFGTNVEAILQVSALTLLLGVQTSKATQVLLNDSLAMVALR